MVQYRRSSKGEIAVSSSNSKKNSLHEQAIEMDLWDKVKEHKWLADEITTDKDKDLVQLVSSSLNWKTDKIRAFVVALLENCNDHQVAKQVNDILSKSD